jgi:hypothetical protein
MARLRKCEKSGEVVWVQRGIGAAGFCASAWAPAFAGVTVFKLVVK